MSKPFFSIIIPTLNEEEYLPRLLTCLKKQKEPSFEIIVVDASSKDRTVAQAATFGQKFPRLTILQTKKANVSLQRNMGAGKSRGKYLVFFDADVQIAPTFLDKLHTTIIQRDLLLTTTYLSVDSSHASDELMISLGNLIGDMGAIVGQPVAVGANIIVERSTFFEIGGFDEHIRHAEDFEFVERAYKKGITLVRLPEPKLVYSLRRLRLEGTLTVLRKQTRAIMHLLLKGPITHELFHYPMGGHLYTNGERRRKRKSAVVKEFNQSLRSIVREFRQLYTTRS